MAPGPPRAGNCETPKTGNPRFQGLELGDLLDYVIVHEMVHLIEPTHNERFIGIVSEHYPGWQEARAELNELALAAAEWRK